MQWIQGPSQSNVDNLNKVRRDASKHSRNKKKHTWKPKLRNLKLTVRSTISGTCIRGINDFKKGYQPRTIIVKDEKGDSIPDSHSIMVRWRNYFSQILKEHGVSDVRQTEIHTVEPLVPEPSTWMLSWLLKSYKVTNHQVLIKYQRNWLR
jgi:hypothetical protein